ncbi:MAG: pitrilysin family protein [Acidobacteriota bacterium]
MIKKEILSNGLTVITEKMPDVRSITLGVWLKKGSRHERPEENGISHFIEHLLFKGTESKSGKKIALIIDSIGGQIDAFTSKEYTCFYAKILDEHLPVALELLSDIVLHPRLDHEDIEKERKVIYEEIKMVEDTPDELVYDIFMENFWKGHPLGNPIQGTVEKIAKITDQRLMGYFRKRYSPGNILIAAAGNLNHRKILSMVEESFGSLSGQDSQTELKAPKPHFAIVKRKKNELEQLHLCLGMDAFPRSFEERYQLLVLNTLLGGAMSSRLFQNIREKRGLAYSIFSGVNTFVDSGFLMVYAATNPGSAKEVLRLIIQELVNLKKRLISTNELKVAKEHLKGSLMLSLESTSSRMSNIARNELYFGRQFSLSEVLKGVDSVKAKDIQELGFRIFNNSHLTLAALGKFSKFRIRKEELEF